MAKKLTVGILAHVDAGKTTLSEAFLYISGMIRKIGRVDKQDAFLDTNDLERERGITIFSKQAVLKLPDCYVTLLDTPGHVDFSAEMERTLSVLDYAVLVISGADGVQGHTKTLWNLLKRYHIPVFIFVNKMDQPGTDEDAILQELKEQLSDNCVKFAGKDGLADVHESVATGSEEALEEFLETGEVAQDTICNMIAERNIFPCYFGSALKLSGVEELLFAMQNLTLELADDDVFRAKAFKIARDENGVRLTYLKIFSGNLKVRTLLTHPDASTEKVNQIRIYSGEKYETAEEVTAGMVCAVTGIDHSFVGEGFGSLDMTEQPVLEPVLSYRILLPEGCNALQILPKLKQLEEEDPMLHMVWNEEHQEILVWVMGEVQIEVLKRQILDRFQTEVEFGDGSIVYKETIANTVEGVGHFEPLRHYAEVHLLLEPAERGSGMTFATNCSEDILDKNWQRLILTHLEEREHLGVLTGSAITDMKITVVSGKAHQKHTEGGDFRQATYRAVRQGLAQAASVLLEPYYEYQLEVPEQMVGRAMTDIEKMNGSIAAPEHVGEMAVLKGTAPVSCMRSYASEVSAYTKGNGRLTFQYGGYNICHNAEEVLMQRGYEFTHDLRNPASSVFCAHGAGFNVEWDEVFDHMHMPSVLSGEPAKELEAYPVRRTGVTDEWIGVEEVDAIIERTLYSNKRDKSAVRRKYKTKHVVTAPSSSPSAHKKQEIKEKYLLVDGYNVIFAWQELKELAAVNIDSARGKLLDILSNYQGIIKSNLIVVFDAYRIEGHKTEIYDYHNIHVVFTKEAETADAYIEKFAHDNAKKYHITVATSDGLEQIIIRGQGCYLLSARELEQDVFMRTKELIQEHIAENTTQKTRFFDGMSEEELEQIRTNLPESI